MPKEYVSEAERLRAYALQERAAVRKLQREGGCTGELKHVLPALSMF